MPRLRFAIVSVGCGLAASAALAQSAGTGGVAGRELYAEYCASCHGTDGRGGGPEAAKRGLRPPDLTTLDERYGSPLPRR